MLKVSSLTSTQATLVGLFAPICWGMSVSLVRGIAEGFGMAQGQFFLYCVATTCVFFIVGLPDFHRIDKRYLYFGIPTANLSSLTFCLAIFTSSGGAQTMEVGMVNYLWPSLTILFAVLFNGVRTRWWLYPGLLVAFGGIIVILSGDKGFSVTEFVARFAENPVSYLLALVAAVTWAGYSSMTRAWGKGINPSTIIFAVDTLLFLVLWLLDIGAQPVAASAHGLMSVIFGGIAVGMATSIPPHNLCEIVDAVKAYMKNNDITVKGLMKYIKGPDFPTGGIVVNQDDLLSIYEKGVGKIKIRGKVEVEKGRNGKQYLVITEIPYPMIGANIGKFLNDVAGLVRKLSTFPTSPRKKEHASCSN